MDRYDAIIVGAGAAGLSASSFAAALDRHVLLLDCANGASSDFAKSGGGPAAAGTRFQEQAEVTDSPEAWLEDMGVGPHAGEYRRLCDGGSLRQPDPGRYPTSGGHKGYDTDAFRKFLKENGIKPVIPGKSNRKKRIRYDKKGYNGRNVVERCFCRLKDFRRIATRYDKLARYFFSALCFVATLAYWL